MKIDRRLFLITLSAPLYPAAPLTVLTTDEAKVVEALCAQIIPADNWPGAKEAGVLYYIDKQLAGTLARFSGEYKTVFPHEQCVTRTKREGVYGS